MATNKRIKAKQDKRKAKGLCHNLEIKAVDKCGFEITNRVNGKSKRIEWDNARA